LGCGLERFVIVVVSAEKSFLNANSFSFNINFVSLGLILGWIGFFAFIFLLIFKIVPAIATCEKE
jgi:hypothetical protein